MRLPAQIATRYLFSKKISLVNVISFISVLGVAGMTAALVVILSVFNGFDSIIRSMINQFAPDLKITASHGKTFHLDSLSISNLRKESQIHCLSCNVEETALFQYDQYQYIASLKGVDDEYSVATDIPQSVYVGDYMLRNEEGIPFAVVGTEIASCLWLQINSFRPISVYVPLRGQKVTIDPNEAFARGMVMPAGVFHIHQEFDSKYVIVPIDYARELLGYDDDEYSSLELRLMPDANPELVAEKLRKKMGDDFEIKTRYQQQDMIYKIMKSEKLSIFVMLTFIIIIASFNIIGALTMLIIDKKRDIQTLSYLGATRDFIRKIFVMTGQLITLTGVTIGVIFGLLICWIQINFEIIKFPEGSFIISAYPVEMRLLDIIATIAVVTLIGFVASAIPSRKLEV